jgi:DNA-binding PadR family transcriptional regulator
MIEALLDKLERDGFIAVEEDNKGEKELIPVSEIVAKSVKKAVKEVCHGK